MTERKPAGMGFESWIDKQVREAEARGEFDNLPGTGQPLPGVGGPYEENWWLKQHLRRENLPTDALLPTSLALRKEIENLPHTVRGMSSESEVRELVRELNLRIVDWLRAGDGPRVRLGTVRTDEVVEQWRAARATTRPPASVEPPAPEPARRWWHRFTR